MGKVIGSIVSVLLAVIVVLVTIFVLNSLGYHAHAQLSASPGSSVTTQAGNLQHVYLSVETFPSSPYTDPQQVNTFKALERQYSTGPGASGSPAIQFPGPQDHPDWVTYWPTTQFVVPAHALVTMTIINWDSQTPLLNPYYSRPYGTVNAQGVANNSESVTTFDSKGNPQVTTYDSQHPVDPSAVSHTFTLRPIPNSTAPWLFVSVPDVGVANDAPTDATGMPLKPVINTFSFVTQGPGVYAWNCFDPCGSRFNGFGGPMQTYGYMSGTLVVQ